MCCRLITSHFSLLEFIKSQGDNFEQRIQYDLVTSSGVRIEGLDISETNFDIRVSEWLYAIRCSIVHSKKTRRGNVEARFVPYSNDERHAELAIPIIQQLAIRCIEKDGEINTTSPVETPK